MQRLFPEPEGPITPSKRDSVVHTPSEIHKNNELSVGGSA